MLKTITGMVPFAIGLAAIGIAIWWLLGREMALGRGRLGAFLVAHGLVHLLFVVPQPATSAEGSGAAAWPFDMSRSWLVTGAGLDINLVHVVGLALICAVSVGFLLAGLATVGILVPAGWWPVLVGASAAASAMLLALFFSLSLVLGLATDAVLLWIVLATVWAPTAVASTG